MLSEIEQLKIEFAELKKRMAAFEKAGESVLLQTIIRNVVLKMKSDGEL